MNNLCLLLRRHGYEAWMVTHDGRREDWLIEPAPTLSLSDFTSAAQKAQAVRCVTSWIDAEAFLAACDSFYYWDMESAYSDRYQFPEIAQAVRQGRVPALAAFSRTIQSCLMARFERPVEILSSLVDDRHWRPDEAKRIRGRVGYFQEGKHTESALAAIQREVTTRVEFHEIRGIESQVLTQMQSCEFFIALNPGKDPLWGEGGPYTPHEALACGVIPLANDLLGLRESIIPGFNGVVVPRGRYDLMGRALQELLSDSAKAETFRQNGRAYFEAVLTLESHWPTVARFLNLSPD